MELEASLADATPDGFKICKEPPPNESLAFSQPASEASKALGGPVEY